MRLAKAQVGAAGARQSPLVSKKRPSACANLKRASCASFEPDGLHADPQATELPRVSLPRPSPDTGLLLAGIRG